MDNKIQEAIQSNDLEALNTLLNDASTDLAQRDPEGRGLLHLAVQAQADSQVLKALVDRVDLALRDQQGQTALDLLASEDADSSVSLREVLEGKVKEMILAGGEEGEKEAQRLLLAGWSHWPVTAEEAQEKSEEAVRVRDKVMELKNKAEGVHKAVQEGRLDDLKELLTGDFSLLVAAADRTGLLPLHKAVLRKQGELVSYLINEFADNINTTDNMGRTALHYAAALTDDSELYTTLKNAGADETVKDLAGKTPADYQQQPDTLSIADILKKLEEEATTTSAAADGDKPEDNTAAADNATTQLTEEETPAQQAEEQQQAQTVEKVKTPSPPPPKEPAKPVEVIPVTMYVSSPERDRAPPPTTVDGRYVAQHLGSALTLALAEIVEKRPWDPIEYLGQWLYKYRKNLDEMNHQTRLLSEIREEEQAANEEEVVKFKRKEEELRIQEEDRIKREEEEAARKKKEQEELQRQAKEAMLAQKPQLPTVREEEVEDNMVRERDEQGQTELHVLAAQSGADLVAVMNLGYSLADRDVNNKTARDIAEEQGLTENVETIDNYVSNLLEQEKLDTLRQLVVEGYDKLDAVLSQVSTEGLPSTVTDFVTSIPDLQEQASAVFSAVSGGVASEVEKALEGKTLALAKDRYGRSPLHLALLAGHHDIVKNIVDIFPLALKTRDNLNRTPLHYAVALSEEMSDLLKASGADSKAKDAKQRTPSFYKDEKEEILQLKTTLSSQATEGTGDITVSVPQIRADDDDAQADDNQTKEEDGQQEENKEENKEEELVIGTTTAQEESTD